MTIALGLGGLAMPLLAQADGPVVAQADAVAELDALMLRAAALSGGEFGVFAAGNGSI
ncbi:MAG: hypothetical protein HC824_10180 [Synechococcales cyanobacterium RM1_1_8]|nr:hypothetical protein [Synechococcales cyanobacterium RM1_1_8]